MIGSFQERLQHFLQQVTQVIQQAEGKLRDASHRQHCLHPGQDNRQSQFPSKHCEAGEGYWLQGEAALQAHSFRDADPQPVIPKKESGWNGLEIARNDRICLGKCGHGRKYI